MSDVLVTDLPIWEDFRRRNLLPKNLELHKGVIGGQEVATIWDPANELHVDFSPRKASRKSIRLALRVLRDAVKFKKSGGVIA